jgi:bifunctional pyridoxal-dependent enzyme with beta-cystathionase and maltose regulon repressor activities
MLGVSARTAAYVRLNPATTAEVITEAVRRMAATL